MTDTLAIDTTSEAKPDLPQCTYKTAKGRRCKLGADHVNEKGNEKHRMVLRTEVPQAKPMKEVVPAGFKLTMEKIPATADLSIERTRDAKPRDEFQERADADVLKAYTSWEKAGKPKGEFAELAVKHGGRYIFPPEAFDSVIALLRAAVTGGGPLPGKRLQYRHKTHESGNSMVYFLITDPEKTTDKKSEDKADETK